MPMSDDQSAVPPVRSEAERFAGTEDEAPLPETGDFHRLTPAGQELVRKIARQLGILMARHDHEEEMGKQGSAATESSSSEVLHAGSGTETG